MIIPGNLLSWISVVNQRTIPSWLWRICPWLSSWCLSVLLWAMGLHTRLVFIATTLFTTTLLLLPYHLIATTLFTTTLLLLPYSTPTPYCYDLNHYHLIATTLFNTTSLLRLSYSPPPPYCYDHNQYDLIATTLITITLLLLRP